MLELARKKNPGTRFYLADMRAFQLGTKYDAVLCLFSAIGYVLTLDRLRDALGCVRDHVKDGGCVLVEPWFSPDQWQPGRVDIRATERDGIKVCRMSHASVRGRTSSFTYDYLIGAPEGVEG